MYVEETDLCRRLADGGWTLRLVPDVRVQHHLKSSTGGAFERRVRETWRSRRRYWAKHQSPLGARAARAAPGRAVRRPDARGAAGAAAASACPAAELRLHLALRAARRSRARACASRPTTGTPSMPLTPAERAAIERRAAGPAPAPASCST